MHAGTLNQKITLRRIDEAESSARTGALVGTFVDVATVWAQVDPTGGAEGISGPGRAAEVSVVARVRFRSDVAPTWRFTWRGQQYDIQSVTPGGQQLREWLDLVGSASPAENPTE